MIISLQENDLTRDENFVAKLLVVSKSNYSVTTCHKKSVIDQLFHVHPLHKESVTKNVIRSMWAIACCNNWADGDLISKGEMNAYLSFLVLRNMMNEYRSAIEETKLKHIYSNPTGGP